MYEQFGKYKDIKWHACAAAQFIGPGGSIQINPDLDNFKLERFNDLRRQRKPEEEKIHKVMLIDNRSKTNIFISGPDELMDRMIERLPLYKNKSWSEIQGMNLGQCMATCENFAMASCDPRVKDMFEWVESSQGNGSPVCDTGKANLICKDCGNYKYNGEI